MSNRGEKFAGSVDCMDGRSKAATAQFACCFVDSLFDGPGAVKFLADRDDSRHQSAIATFTERMAISYHKHGTREVYVTGHAECAGHPVPDATHKHDALKATAVIRELVAKLGYEDVTVTPLWNERVDNKWQSTELEVISAAAAA